MNFIKIRLLGDGSRGYRQIIKFSVVQLVEGNLIVDCPLRDDALALMQQFGNDLHLIVQQLKMVETVEIKADGETIYKARPIDLLFWQ